MSSVRSPIEFQHLEARQLLSGSPATTTLQPSSTSPSALLVRTQKAAPKSALTLADRRQLLANWVGPNASQLKGLLDSGNVKGFDNALLKYMVNRTNIHYFFELGDRADYVDYIYEKYNNNASKDDVASDKLTEVFENADAIVGHNFPETATSTSYTHHLPDDIDWLTFKTSERQFIHGLNRFFYWDDLANAHQLSLGKTGYSNKYVNELKWQLNDWAKQHKPLADPDTWQDKGVEPRWWLQDAALRGQTWVDAYFKVLGTSGWDATSNTLFLHRIFLHGDFLRKVTPLPLDQNQTATHAAGLLNIAQLFPEFKGSNGSKGSWDTYGRKLLANAFGKQFYADGGHIEQSVTYQGSVLHTLLERYQLDKLNGRSWGSKMFRKLKNSVESFYQLLTPTGDSPALADSYRRPQIAFFTEARLVLNNTKYPLSRPRLANIWFLGPDRLSPPNGPDALFAQTPPVLSNRGDAYGMAQSGYYVLRSNEENDGGRDTRQLTFDIGPTGGQSHGHFDLLNLEYVGYGRVLIASPGALRYDDSADRAYVISTPAANTISIDGKSHAQLEGPTNAGFALDTFDTSNDAFSQVAGHHFGYKSLAGSPAVGRSIWFNKDNVMIVADWAKSSASHAYSVSFNLPTTKVSSIANGRIRTQFTTNGDEKDKTGGNIGNVQITSLTPGATLKREQKFTSSQPPPNEKDAAIRFSANKSGKNVVFIALIQSFDGTSLAAGEQITAEFLQDPIFGRPLQIQLKKNGADFGNPITIQPPVLNPPAASETSEPPIAEPTPAFSTHAIQATDTFLTDDADVLT